MQESLGVLGDQFGHAGGEFERQPEECDGEKVGGAKPGAGNGGAGVHEDDQDEFPGDRADGGAGSSEVGGQKKGDEPEELAAALEGGADAVAEEGEDGGEED